MSKNLSNKYGQKFLDSAKIYEIDAIKTASKRAEATGDLIVNKIAHKITSVSNKSPRNWILKNYKLTKWKHQNKIHISRRTTTN